MPETQTEEKTVERKPVVLVNPFHIRRLSDVKAPGELRMIPRITEGNVKIDKETLVVTPVVERFDIDAEIQSHKAECGLEYFKLMLAQGRTTKDASHDDGKHGLNMSEIPETIHEAHAQSVAASDAIANLAKALGVKDGKAITSDELIELLSEKVQANAAANAARSAVQPTQTTEDK